jgi:hypothetical protein
MATELVIELSDRSVTARLCSTSNVPAETHSLPASSLALPPEDLAEIVVSTATAIPISASTVTLVLPSSWCYVHRCSVPQRRPTHDALMFAFEEFVPVDAEQLTCDFVRTAAGDYLGIAVDTARVRPLVEALAARHLRTEHITLNALWHASPAETTATVLWCDDQHVALLERTAQGLKDLRVVRLADGLADEGWCTHARSHVDGTDLASAIVTGCTSTARLTSLAETLGVPVADQRAANVAPGQGPCLLDLARGALASPTQRGRTAKVWRRSAAVTLVALLALAVGLHLERARLQRELTCVGAWEQQIFRELFPQEPIPTGVALRLTSERRRLEGLTLSEKRPSLPSADAIETLRALVTAIPADLRLDLQELRIEAGDVSLRGRIRDHRQAEQMAAAVGRSANLVCAAPRTNRLSDGGVQFFLHGQRPLTRPTGGQEAKP